MSEPFKVDPEMTIGGVPVRVSENTPPNAVEFVFPDHTEVFWCAADGGPVHVAPVVVPRA